MAGAVAVAAMLTGCSENVADGLYADNDSNITLSVTASGLSNGKLDIGSAQSSTVFTVTSTSRWKAEITDCEGSWCQVVYGDNTSAEETEPMGNGVFLVDASPNRSGSARDCILTVYGIEVDGTHIPGKAVEIHLTQDRQSIEVNYSGDVISAYGTNQGAEPLVTVTANQGWKVVSSQAWVKIIPGAGMDGDSYTPAPGAAEDTQVSFRISVEANPGTSTRYAEVTIESTSNAFTPVRLNITQTGSTETFLVTPANVPAVNHAGGTVEFQVLSPREAWTAVAVSAGDWVTLDRTSNEASSDIVTVRAVISANQQNADRQAAVIFTREGGMGETIITINQNGDPSAPEVTDPEFTPSVSDAWLISGWTQTHAIVRAYYNSPSIELEKCGACVCPVVDGVDGEVRNYAGRFSEDSSISVTLDDLQPNTTYKVWCYVEYTLDGVGRGASGGILTFTTPDNHGQPDTDPGTTPGIGDNEPPSNN